MRPLVIAAVVAAVAFVVANPYALLDARAFGAGLTKQSATAADGGGKLGLGEQNALLLLPAHPDLGARLAAAASPPPAARCCWRCATAAPRSC